ncbi:MAG: flagellin [Candidatus Sericytochromatia bacterium]|nr:flagellin [Candidatus Tanganyikabacteria bacterium]
MGLRINTNITAMNAHRLLGINDNALSKSLQKLSSGLRINGAQDDAAGLAISEKFKSQVIGLNQAVANSQDAVNLLQTAEGGLNETEVILQRMRELAVQGANDTLTVSDRNNITDELQALSKEIDRIAKTTQFNTKVLLDGGTASTAGFTFQVGANSNQFMNVQIETANAVALGVFFSNISVDNAANASQTISNLDDAIAKVSAMRSKLGANINRLEHTISNLNVQAENMSASNSRIRDLDMAKEASALTRNQILAQSSQAMLAQANQGPQSVLQLLR